MVFRMGSLHRRPNGTYHTGNWPVGLDPDLRAGYTQAAARLDPVLVGRAAGETFMTQLRNGAT